MVARGSNWAISVISKLVVEPGKSTIPAPGKSSFPEPPGHIFCQSQLRQRESFGASIALPPAENPRIGAGLGGHCSLSGLFSLRTFHISFNSDSICCSSSTEGKSISLTAFAPKYQISSELTISFLS